MLNEKSQTIDEVLAVMDSAQSIAIAGHINPDGDAIGSALALRDLLEAKGKEVTILLGQDHAAPELYDFLPRYDFVLASDYDATPDLFIVVDASTAKRLGTCERLIASAKDTLVIDHHTNYEGFAHHYIGDSTAPAAASIVWRIIKASGVAPTLAMATYCYVGIMTDTGRFAFKNTNRSSFADAVEMIDLGVDPAEISMLVYENKTLPAMRIEAHIISQMQFSCDGSVVYSYLRAGDLRALGVERDATEGLPTILRSIKGVEVAVLFREEGKEGVRVNLRSRSNFDVGAFALTLGGGGHAGAAGVSLDLSLEDAMELVVGRLVAELPACGEAQ
jgi:phosphoesterase RecJ-like protein